MTGDFRESEIGEWLGRDEHDVWILRASITLAPAIHYALFSASGHAIVDMDDTENPRDCVIWRCDPEQHLGRAVGRGPLKIHESAPFSVHGGISG